MKEEAVIDPPRESPLEAALARILATTMFPTPTTWLREHAVPGLPFVLDFYCPEWKIGVEADGGGHAGTRHYDSFRDSLIAKGGIQVIRFTGQDLLYRPGSVARRLKEEVTLRWMWSLERYRPVPYPHDPYSGASPLMLSRQSERKCMMECRTCKGGVGSCYICGDPHCVYHLGCHLRAPR